MTTSDYLKPRGSLSPAGQDGNECQTRRSTLKTQTAACPPLSNSSCHLIKNTLDNYGGEVIRLISLFLAACSDALIRLGASTVKYGSNLGGDRASAKDNDWAIRFAFLFDPWLLADLRRGKQSATSLAYYYQSQLKWTNKMRLAWCHNNISRRYWKQRIRKGQSHSVFSCWIPPPVNCPRKLEAL